MKKTLVYGIATAAVLASLGAGFGLAQCAFQPQPALYGPPPSDEPSGSSEADDPIEDVYGPPVDVRSSDSTSNEDDFEEDEIPTALYGPPPETNR